MTPLFTYAINFQMRQLSFKSQNIQAGKTSTCVQEGLYSLSHRLPSFHRKLLPRTDAGHLLTITYYQTYPSAYICEDGSLIHC